MNQFSSLENMRAVVTGSSSGIGRSIALKLAAAGADVVVHCLQSIDQAEQVASEILTSGRRSAVIQGDVGDAGSLGQLVDTAWKALGGVDVWVNNAGVDLLTGDQAKLPYADKLEALLDIDVRAAARMATPESKAQYARRSPIAETPFAWLKAVLGLRQFRHVGLEKVETGWRWACLTLNLKKILSVLSRLRRLAREAMSGAALDV